MNLRSSGGRKMWKFRTSSKFAFAEPPKGMSRYGENRTEPRKKKCGRLWNLWIDEEREILHDNNEEKREDEKEIAEKSLQFSLLRNILNE